MKLAKKIPIDQLTIYTKEKRNSMYEKLIINRKTEEIIINQLKRGGLNSPEV